MFIINNIAYICTQITTTLKHNIMARFDYRRELKGLTQDEALTALSYYKDKLLQNICFSESNCEYYGKRISYLKEKYKLE